MYKKFSFREIFFAGINFCEGPLRDFLRELTFAILAKIREIAKVSSLKVARRKLTNAQNLLNSK